MHPWRYCIVSMRSDRDGNVNNIREGFCIAIDGITNISVA